MNYHKYSSSVAAHVAWGSGGGGGGVGGLCPLAVLCQPFLLGVCFSPKQSFPLSVKQ